jgi:hypothetical protein
MNLSGVANGDYAETADQRDNVAGIRSRFSMSDVGQ